MFFYWKSSAHDTNPAQSVLYYHSSDQFKIQDNGECKEEEEEEARGEDNFIGDREPCSNFYPNANIFIEMFCP